MLSDAATHLPVPRHTYKWRSAVENLRRACREDSATDEFVLWNDDFVVTRPIDDIPTLHRGTLSSVISEVRGKVGHSSYLQGMIESQHVLTSRFGISSPVSYALHTPFVYDRSKLLEVLETSDRVRDPAVQATDTRTMYGNLVGIGGRRVRDVKLSRFTPVVRSPLPFRSTDPESWNSPSTDFLRDMFPNPSLYERS